MVEEEIQASYLNGVCDCYYVLIIGRMPGIYSGVNTKGWYNQVGNNGTNTI
uniref:Uncharacterized protein n=1 Tax=Candidatus Methanophagaceae archaeon ANME-1 ERB6 TaxID=2759912 RepID=A0A7G9Z0P9_9EURY|nr:hypothetical protein ALDDBJOO_00009 [Methanosarcinales archaeon ANME-1 ERB6]